MPVIGISIEVCETIKILILVEDWGKEILNSDKNRKSCKRSKCYRKVCWWINFTKTESMGNSSYTDSRRESCM